MNILLLGNGGREHAFAWKLSQSPGLKKLFIAPGNAGTSGLGSNIPVNLKDFESISNVVREQKIEMLIVGPEMPLVSGISDYMNARFSHLQVIGPNKSASMLEGSKSFAKSFMERHGIPTASYHQFSNDDVEKGLRYLDNHPLPIVLKADGLAAGKGVLICSDREHAKAEFTSMLKGKFGEASKTVLVEQFLDGMEFSVFVVSDGSDYCILPTAKDYKRIGVGDTGLNTGGMGSVSPVPFVNEAFMKKVENKIIRPTIAGLQSENIEYRGFLFFGLIAMRNEPLVIEYNCRMGDPETQSVFSRLKTDLVELCVAIDGNRIHQIMIEEDERAASTVVLVSGGYPGNYEKGKKIEGLELVKGSIIFHAGTRMEKNNVLTNGGRVLAITSLAETFHQAIQISNANAEVISFEGKYYRKDIGFDL